MLKARILIGFMSFSFLLTACSDKSRDVEEPDTDGWLEEPNNYSVQDSTFHPAIDWDHYELTKSTPIAVDKRRVEASIAPYTKAAGNRWIKPLLDGAKVSCTNVRASQRVSYYNSLGNSMWVVKAACDNQRVYSLQPRDQKSESDLRLPANWRIAPWDNRILIR